MKTTMTRKKRRTVTSPSRRSDGRVSLTLFPAVARVLLPGLALAILASSPSTLAGSAPAQSNVKLEKPYALIFGTVWSPDNRPVYGVKIQIRRVTDRKATWEIFSDHNGEFAQRVPVGKQDYVVWADLKGVKLASGKPQKAEEVQVHIDNDERADIGVHLTE
jgi:hypothetical protein